MENSSVEILHIKDNMNDAELAIRALRKRHFNNNLVHLQYGAKALEFLFGTGKFEGRHINNKPKVILVDLKKPKLDKLKVLTQIKTNELTKAIPLVVHTSSKKHPDMERVYALGAKSCILKPFEFEEFTKVITDLGFY